MQRYANSLHISKPSLIAMIYISVLLITQGCTPNQAEHQKTVENQQQILKNQQEVLQNQQQILALKHEILAVQQEMQSCQQQDKQAQVAEALNKIDNQGVIGQQQLDKLVAKHTDILTELSTQLPMADVKSDNAKHYQQTNDAEATDGDAGQKILAIGNKMVTQTKEVIKGSCWDYINTVYNRAGYPANQRLTVHKGSKDTGPYANIEQIKAGDWLYYINHSYKGVEHSGIFINWVDKSKNIANILSYGGEDRQEPGRYSHYDLSNVYIIIRAK